MLWAYGEWLLAQVVKGSVYLRFPRRSYSRLKLAKEANAHTTVATIFDVTMGGLSNW